jgi:phage terminase large subunit GpA-like protein
VSVALQIVYGAARLALVPRPRIPVSEWADAHRTVAPGTSPEPGPWRTNRVPYLREPMDAVSDPAVERVVCMWASQLGKSELLINVIGYFVHQDPSPILFVQPTEGAADSFSKERLAPTFRESPSLRNLISETERDKDNTIQLKKFPGGYLAMAWATSPTALASRPIRIVLSDEIDRWVVSTGKDGDPLAQAIQRTANFHNRKIVLISTPTTEGESAIERAYEDTDQRRFHVPCPRCGVFQVLEWSGVIYKNAVGEVDLDNVYYRCADCKGRIEERDRPAMIDAGEWKPENPGHAHRGFQLSSLYSPWVRWSELAAEWARANKDRDQRGKKEFINLRLGELWIENRDEITVEALEKNREEYEAEIPDGALLLVAGVDVQDNRLEVEIVGWGALKESWGIHYAILPGDTSTPAPWVALDALLARTWSRADESKVPLWCACIDSGGHRTDEVYEFCRDRTARNVFAVKGYAGAGRPIVGKPTLNKLRANLFAVGVDGAKEVLYSRLMLALPGPGACHFPVARETGYDAEYFKGLVSERRKAKVRAGRRVLAWVQTYARNEPLDCRVYATAAMELVVSTNGGDAYLAQLAAAEEKRRGAPAPASAPMAAPRRRVHSRGVE